jgi:hypothetical protein
MSINIQRIKTTIKRHFPAVVPLAHMLRSKVGRPIQAAKGAVEPATNRVSMSDVFGQVYAANYWGNAESRSGNGSDLKQTAVIRAEIPKLIRDLGVVSMLDIPCGDFFWMQRCQTGLETYIGADVVPKLVRDLNEQYSNARRRFETLDLTEDALPKVDLVLCRDLLVHFSSNDIRRAVVNVKRSWSTYLLTTTFTDRDQNRDITTSGDWRPLNLELPPISFPKPVRLINEGCTEYQNQFKDKSLGLWRLADI